MAKRKLTSIWTVETAPELTSWVLNEDGEMVEMETELSRMLTTNYEDYTDEDR